MKYTPLIIGNDHHNTLGVIESLGAKGVKSDVIIVDAITNSYVQKSRYIDKSFLVKDCVCLLTLLKTTFPKYENTKYIVIATCDEIALTLNQHAKELSKFCILPGTEDGQFLQERMNKQFMVNLAAEIGLNVPKTVLYTKGGKIPNNISFPCISKSIQSAGNGKTDLHVFQDNRTLAEFLVNRSHSDIIQIQEYIDKDFEFQLLGCSLNGGDHIIIPGHTTVTRPALDNTCFLKFETFDDSYGTIIERSKKLIKESHYSGLFSIEFIRDKFGKDYFLEINFRNDGNAICVTSSGTNLPYIWYLYNSKANYMEELNQSVVNEVYLIPEYFDFLRVIYYKEITFMEWLRNMHKATCYTTYFKNDRKPFYSFMKRNIVSLLKSLLNKISR